jgi:hypothetical protein
MNRSAVTLGRHIIEDEHRHHNTTGELSRLLVQIGFAAKIIAREVGRAALVGKLGLVGEKNVTGDAQILVPMRRVSRMPSIIAFDVNETLLDLSALDSRFQSKFGDPEIRREWFEQVLKLAFVSTIVGSYSDFGAIGRAALLVVEQKRKKVLSEGQRLEILQAMRNLPAHPDVKEGFRRLRDRGWRLVALTNSTSKWRKCSLRMQVCATTWNACSRPIRFAASSPQRSHTKWRHENSGSQPRIFYLWQHIRGTSRVPPRRDAGRLSLRGQDKCSMNLHRSRPSLQPISATWPTC